MQFFMVKCQIDGPAPMYVDNQALMDIAKLCGRPQE
jgi:hypothetical protein